MPPWPVFFTHVICAPHVPWPLPPGVFHTAAVQAAFGHGVAGGGGEAAGGGGDAVTVAGTHGAHSGVDACAPT
eukprot:4026153-Prymnesium_polylepis.1